MTESNISTSIHVARIADDRLRVAVLDAASGAWETSEVEASDVPEVLANLDASAETLEASAGCLRLMAHRIREAAR